MDLQILSELSNDASISVPRLSKKIDVNSSVVYSRIKRLVKRKLIERFTIDVNDAELGYEVKALTGINIDTKQRDNQKKNSGNICVPSDTFTICIRSNGNIP